MNTRHDRAEKAPRTSGALEVGLLTGGFDRPYAFGLAMALNAEGVDLDVLGSDEVDSPEMHATPSLNFINLQPGWGQPAGYARKLLRLIAFYARIARYAVIAKPRVFHILWNPRVAIVDRVVLMLLYKACGRKVALTAHNVNTKKRDDSDSAWNRLTLKIQYRMADVIFVHTKKMQQELVQDFRVRPESTIVIPFGINNAVPHTNLSCQDAKVTLGLHEDERILLCFGRIQPYKGLEHAVDALGLLGLGGAQRYRLIIAGAPKKESETYWRDLRERIESCALKDRIVQHIGFIPDDETECYFKAADALILPYKGIYQSGVLSLAYSFGLPVIASDVGSFREDVIEGRTGDLCLPGDPADLARVIKEYFDSALYRDLERTRLDIRNLARQRYSWSAVGAITSRVYAKLQTEV